jgi:hypothetical protein
MLSIRQRFVDQSPRPWEGNYRVAKKSESFTLAARFADSECNVPQLRDNFCFISRRGSNDMKKTELRTCALGIFT